LNTCSVADIENIEPKQFAVTGNLVLPMVGAYGEKTVYLWSLAPTERIAKRKFLAAMQAYKELMGDRITNSELFSKEINTLEEKFKDGKLKVVKFSLVVAQS